MKRLVTIIVSLVVGFICINCNNAEKITGHIVCRCILAPTSVGHDTYLIEVNDTGLIRTSYGCIPDTIVHIVCKDEKINPIQTRLIENVEKKEESMLGNDDYHHLIKLIERINVEKCDNPFVEGWFWDDAWMVILMIDDKQFVYEKSNHPNKNVNAIVDELVRLSPIAVSFDKLEGGIEKVFPLITDTVF